LKQGFSCQFFHLSLSFLPFSLFFPELGLLSTVFHRYREQTEHSQTADDGRRNEKHQFHLLRELSHRKNGKKMIK
jgi:hypothetical protein